MQTLLVKNSDLQLHSDAPKRHNLGELREDLSQVKFSRIITATNIEQHLKLIEKFSDLQLKAYLDRLDLQPNGAAVKVKQLKVLDSPQSKLLRLSIGRNVLERLEDLGQDPLKLMRAFGESLLQNPILKVAQQNGQEFEKCYISGLVNTRGEKNFLAPEILMTLANIFHTSWKLTARETFFQNHIPATIGDRSELITRGNDLDPKVINYDCLTSMMLCKHLALLSDIEFKEILNYAKPGNPHRFELSFKVVDSSSNYFQEISPSISLTSCLPELVNEKFRGVNSIKISNQIENALIRFNEELIQKELMSVVPATLRRINQLGSSSDQEFENICQKLENLRIAREQWSFGLKFALEGLPKEFSEFNGDISEMPCAWVKTPGIRKVLIDLESDYRVQFKSCSQTKQTQTESLIIIGSYSQFEKYRSEISTLLQKTNNNPADPAYSRDGGIIYNYYQDKFWKELFANQGKLLVALDQQQIQGVLVYYQPGMIPKEHIFVPENFRLNTKTSYTEIVVTSQERASGTFAKLFRGMLANLQLTKAEFAEGIVYELNQRSLSAVKDFGYFSRTSQAIQALLPKQQETLAIPICIPVQSKLRQALGGLSKALAKMEIEN